LVPGARITYIGPVPPFRGGIAQHGARTVQALIDAGRPVEVLSWARQYPKALYPGRERDPAAKPFPGARFLLRWWDPVSWVRAGRRARRGDLMVFPWVTPVQAPPRLRRSIDAARPGEGARRRRAFRRRR
jgi:hypothetical protein